jgi:hypothetical protein
LKQTETDDTNSVLPQHGPSNVVIDHITTSPDEVYDLLKCIDTSKATGPDGISPRMLREAAPAIAEPLSNLFNLSLLNHKVPTAWKRANVVPIHKKNSRNIVDNYRPISLLSCVGKLMERIIFKHLFNHVRDNKILSEFQSGFVPGDSTVNQLVQLYHLFSEALDQKKDVRIVFCDISKAFDRVWHKGLLHKLEKIGINGDLLEWFKNYLDHRCQRVLIEGESSDWGTLKAGVPQGSVLGPLYFLFISMI